MNGMQSDQDPPMFAALRRTEDPFHGILAPQESPLVRLHVDESGAWLEPVNRKGEPLPIHPGLTTGALRDLLKAMAQIRRRQEEFVGWDAVTDRIYLHDHEHLVWPLKHCDALVGEDLQPIAFTPGEAGIRLALEEDTSVEPSWIAGKLHLVRDGEADAAQDAFRFLSESHVLVGHSIHTIHPVGENFAKLSLFGSRFPGSMTDRCLSLLFSHFNGVSVSYRGYATRTGERLQTIPAILFQNADDTGGLHFNLIHTVPGLPPDFTQRHEITRIVQINDAESSLVVREVTPYPLDADRHELGRALTRCQRELSGKAGTHLIADDGGFVIGKELASQFLGRELANLARRYVLIGTEKLMSYRIKPVTPKLRLRLGFGIDYLDGDAGLEIEGRTFSLMDVLAQLRKESFVVLEDGTRGVISSDMVAKLTRLFKKHDSGVRVSFFDLPLVEELLDENSSSAPFVRAREIYLGFNQLAKDGLPALRIQGELRPYQAEGLKWMDYLNRHGLGGCLADDMGLGKTVQTIALLSMIYPGEPTPSLLVMPRSLLFNWQREIERFCPDLRFQVFHGAARDLDTAMQSQLVLTTYGTLRGGIEKFLERQFHYVILDESQAIKNLDTQTSRAVMLLKARRRLALSGTPIENHLGELLALFRFLNPAMFGSEADFNRCYGNPIHQDNDKEAARELRKKIYPFILRRLKRDVLKDLPDKVEQTLYIDMSQEQRNLYETRRRFYHDTIKRRIAEVGMHASRFFILEALMELRQVATIPEEKSEGAIVSPKREALLESLRDAVLNGHKALVFTNFLAAIDLLAGDLEKMGIGYLTMTGATANREQLVHQFQTRADIKVFLMTLKTGGVGLNLTAADTVFILDPWWNTAAESQAIDRTHRIGQDRTVFTYKLIVRDSVEEKIVQLQAKKRDLFDAVIGSDGTAFKSLTEQDVDAILGQD
jgi:superfamily II DNA or RNA helicase